MRVLLAPDKLAGTLGAARAARALAEGWREVAPDDHLDLAPMSDGGPGFLDALAAGLPGAVREPVVVRGPLGGQVPAEVLLVRDRPGGDTTAYVESAQACGLELTGRDRPEAATTLGVGDLLRAAVDAGARRVVVGLGGSGTTDGGAGLLAALGAGADRPLDAGPAALAGVGTVDLAPARVALGEVELVVASDVDSPLTGLFGAAKVFGPQKGLVEERLPAVDGVLQDWAVAVGPDGRRAATLPGAGAAGGLGFALGLLGAVRRPGVALVADVLDLAARARAADLVVTGEGAFDHTSRVGKVPGGVAALAAAAVRPCVVVAGRVEVGAREMRALGIEAAYALVDAVGEERALGDPAGSLAHVGARLARAWSRPG